MRQLRVGQQTTENYRQAFNLFQIKREDEGQVRDQEFDNRYTKDE